MLIQASLKKRSLYKLTTNFVGLGIGIAAQSIIPRALGPAAYGNFSFLTNFFWQLVSFINFNSSTALFTKLSQRQNDRKLIKFYLYFSLIMGLILVLFLIVCFILGIDKFLWPCQAKIFILMALAWAFLRYYNDVLIQISDAFALTVKSEIINIIQKIFGLMIIIILFWKKWFTLLNFFSQQLFIFLLSVILLIWIIQKGKGFFFNQWLLKKNEIVSYFNEFWIFCLPLVVLSCFSIFEGLTDRWFVQKFSGSIQQGYFGLAYQISIISILFSTALIPLIGREYAISFQNKNIKELSRLFLRFSPMLFAITAYFSCFLAVESKNVMLLFGGKAYTGAVLPITIMCFYPIHQTYGQMNATVFFATGTTKTYRNIGIIMVFIGLILTFFLIGPKKYGAMQLGADGLAVKMVFIQLLSVNIQLSYILKILKLPMKKFINHQLLVIIIFISIALFSSYIINTLLPGSHFFYQFLMTGILYTIGIFIISIYFPTLLALKKGEIFKLLGMSRIFKLLK